jgi:hypothetical protein
VEDLGEDLREGRVGEAWEWVEGLPSRSLQGFSGVGGMVFLGKRAMSLCTITRICFVYASVSLGLPVDELELKKRCRRKTQGISLLLPNKSQSYEQNPNLRKKPSGGIIFEWKQSRTLVQQ